VGGLEAPYRPVRVWYIEVRRIGRDRNAFKKNGGDRRMGDKNPFVYTHRRPYGHTSEGKKKTPMKPKEV
jgi:hypothetical protein